MKLKIEHRTTYRYSREVGLLPHRLMLSPRQDQSLRTLEFELQSSPAGTTDWSQDVFGNIVGTLTFLELAAELTITSNATVEQTADQFPLFRIDPSAHSYPFAYSLADFVDLGAFVTPSADSLKVRQWADAFVLGESTDTLSLLKDINVGILNTVGYRIRDEEGTQSPEQTLELASGSCRDIAVLFIDGVRHLGFGARAVSGYVFDPQASVNDRGSTHAWAEVYLPGAGWIAFDPTHRRVGEASLIPAAIARSIGQIMPVTGGYVGEAADFASLQVVVKVELV